MNRRPASRISIVLLLVLALCFTLFGVWFSHRERAAREDAFDASPTASQDPNEPDAPPLDAPVAGTHTETRTASGDTETGTATVRPEPGGKYHVHGRVLDLLGRPVADAAITANIPDPSDALVLARTDEQGAYAFDTNQLEGVLAASTSELRALRTHVWHSQADVEGLIVVAPCADLHGLIVDEEQGGVKNARVAVDLPENALSRIPQDLSQSGTADDWSVLADAAGRFEFRRAYTALGARIRVSAPGFLTAWEEVPSDIRRPLTITLARDPNAGTTRITGVVVRADGSATSAAIVVFADSRVACDAEGRFSIPVIKERAGDDWPLAAFEPGSQGVSIPKFGQVVRQSAGEIPAQRLVLGGPALSIRGHVLDDRGEPLAGCTVALLDPVVASDVTSPPTTVEELASNNPGVRRTDADGSFELGGLSERDYRLQVVDDQRLGRIETDPIRAGANDVVVRYPADAMVHELRGRVVGRDGTPLEGVQVNVMVVTSRIGTHRSAKGFEPKISGPDGSFRFTDVPRRNAELQLSASTIANKNIPLDGLDLSSSVDVVADRYCPVRFAGLDDATTPQWVGAVDAQGHELMVFRDSGNRRSGSNRMQLGDDSAQVYLVSEAVTEFVRYSPYDAAVARQPTQLVPNEVRIVRW